MCDFSVVNMLKSIWNFNKDFSLVNIDHLLLTSTVKGNLTMSVLIACMIQPTCWLACLLGRRC